jgi:CubicO group peptidase (beta-lactamase class C family)
MTTEPWLSLADHLDSAADEGTFSGTVLITVGEETVLHACHGIANRSAAVPVMKRTRFEVASLSKMFTAAAVLSVLDDAGVSVHAPVSGLMPEHRRPRTLDPAVTVHHLLTHTSGIGDYAEEDEKLPGYVPDYSSLWRDIPSYRMRRPDDFLPLYADLPPVSRPGEAYHYCNAGFVLLGALLEELTGGEFSEVVTSRVLQRAGMAHSGYFALDEARPDIALGYFPPERPGGPWRSNIYSIPIVGGGDGGAFVTALDVDRFLRAVASGSLLGPGTTARMLTPHAQVDDGLWMGHGAYLRADGSFGYGGGDPGVEAIARHLPSRHATMVILANVEGALDAVYDQVVAAFRTL